MKHPHHITTDYLPVSKDEIRPVTEGILSRLSAIGLKGKVSSRWTGISRVWKVSFPKPVAGRDWKDSRIKCTGVAVHFCNGLGRDERRDENDRTVFVDGRPALEGEPYVQHTASFRFCGTETRYRCRSVESIQDKTMSVFQYDDDWNGIDFRQDIAYLAGIR